MINLIVLIILLLVLVAIFVAGVVVLSGWRSRGQLERALNLSLLLVRVTRESGSEANAPDKKNAKELINITEQLISTFSNLHAKGWNKFIFGEPYLALEIAVHHIGEETHFYLAVPSANETAILKQLYAYYPSADISKVKDYNIFHPHGATAGAFLAYSGIPILPIRTYQTLETDPMSGVLTALSKLENDGEGAAVQLLIRPS